MSAESIPRACGGKLRRAHARAVIRERKRKESVADEEPDGGRGRGRAVKKCKPTQIFSRKTAASRALRGLYARGVSSSAAAAAAAGTDEARPRLDRVGGAFCVLPFFGSFPGHV